MSTIQINFTTTFHNASIKANADYNKNISVIIINPYLNDGSGDLSLANKLETIINSLNIRTKIITINAMVMTYIEEYSTDNLPQQKQLINEICKITIKEQHAILSEMIQITKKLAFLIAPANLLSDDYLAIFIDTIKTTYQLEDPKLFLINEMATPIEYPLTTSTVTKHETCTLGFTQNDIGFLSVDASKIAMIQDNYQTKLHKFFDGFKNLGAHDNFFISYLSSADGTKANSHCIAVFIHNTQVEHLKYNSNSNSRTENTTSHYIISFDNFIAGTATELTTMFQGLENNETPPAIINIYEYHENGITAIEIKKKKVQSNHQINIYLGGKLPQEMFLCLIAGATDGMMTGDNSLAEYLSIKEAFPYYQMREFKSSLIDSILDTAKQFDEDILIKYLNAKIVDYDTRTNQSDFRLLDKSLLDKIYKSKSKQEFDKALTAKNAEPLLTTKFTDFLDL